MNEQDMSRRVVCKVLYSTGAEQTCEMERGEGERLIASFNDSCDQGKAQIPTAHTAYTGAVDTASGEYEPADRLCIRLDGVLSIEMKEAQS